MDRAMSRAAALLLGLWLLVPIQTATAQNDPSPAGQTYSPGQLEQMVAPIALYPDSLISQILIAATYPVQVVEAAQWLQKNKSLKGTQAQKAAASEGWDPSVQSLVQFPQVVDRMYANLEWTQNLGEAFLAQQGDVLNTIQAMRQKAYAAGNLKSTSKQKVVVQETTIVIVPAQPQVVYVPSYNPVVVYGAAWAPPTWYYPPAVYAPLPGYNPAAGVIAFGVGVAVGAAWGSASNCSWHTGNVTVNNNYYYRSGAAHYSSGGYYGPNGSVAHAGNTTAAYNANTGEVKSYNSVTGNTRSGDVTQGARGTAVQGDNGSAARVGNTTAAYNKNTGQVNSYNSATGNSRSGDVTQGARGTAVQGDNGSAARAGNTTAAYNKNTGQVNSYNSATGNSRSGNVNNAGSSNWQHDSAQRQGQPYGNSSLNQQYGGGQNGAAARGYGGGGGGQAAAASSGGGRFESAASDRGWASRGGGGGGGGGGFGGGGGGRGGRGRR
jgi:hypothetical protein